MTTTPPSTWPESLSTPGPGLTPGADHEFARMHAAGPLLKRVEMGAPNLRLISEDTIDLDSPEAGLTHTLEGIAGELGALTEVKRDVKSWALIGAGASSVLTVGAVAGMMVAFRPAPAPPAIVIQPAPIAVVVTPPAPAAVAAPTPAPAGASEPDQKFELPAASESDLAVRRAFSLLWAGRPKAALKEAEGVLTALPTHVDALAAVALAQYDLHRDRAARLTVKKALKLNPQHPLANVLRGTMAQVDHDVSSALAHYEKYLRQRPSGVLAEELVSVRQNLHPKGTP